MTSFLKALSF